MAFSMERLSEINAVSGFEGEARAYLIPILRGKKCDTIEVDSMGNIVAFKKGESDKYKILLGTNIDEIGFIVSDITDSGFIKFKAVGTIDPRTLVSKRVMIGKNRVPGVIGMKAIHLQKKEEREAAVEVKALYIDIGAKDKDDAKTRVALGDTITFDTKFTDRGDLVKGKALDRFGVIPVLTAMDITPKFDTYYVFSAQREIPCSVMGRGMRIASCRIEPDIALIVNTVNSDDFPDVKSASARLGDGAIIEYMDRTSISDTAMINVISDMAKRKGITIQKKTSARGDSIAGAVMTAGKGAVCASIGIPCRYSHTPVSYINKNDIEAVCDVCKLFVKESDVIIDGIIKEADRA